MDGWEIPNYPTEYRVCVERKYSGSAPAADLCAEPRFGYLGAWA